MPNPTEANLHPTLERNLRALATRDPGLAERLMWPVDMGHLDLGNESPPTYRLHYERYPLLLAEDEPARLAASLPEEGEVLLFGFGLGELAAHLVRVRPALKVVAWDRDPGLVRAALTRRDLCSALGEGRLRLALGVDLVAEIERQAERTVLLHPLLGEVYTHERALLERGVGQPRVALGLGGLFVDDVAEALRDEGYSVLPMELLRWSIDELRHCVRSFDPQLIVAINHSSGLAEFAQAEGKPLLVWEVDPAMDAPMLCDAPTADARIFTFRRANVEAFRAAGFEHVEYLPLASNDKLRRPIELTAQERERYAAPLSFVGASLVASSTDFRRRLGLLYGNWHPDGMEAIDELERILDQILAEQRRDFSRFLVPALLEEHLGDFVAAMRRTVREDPAMLVGEMAAAERRRAWVSELGPLGIHVWGDAHWPEVLEGGARYRGSAGHHSELTRVYGGSDINIDIGRLYQTDIVTMRVFDVLACGGFLIAERSPALEELFAVGEELESYSTIEELTQKVRHYLEHPQEARRIAGRGLEAVRTRHTIRERLRHMLGSLAPA